MILLFFFFFPGSSLLFVEYEFNFAPVTYVAIGYIEYIEAGS